MKNVVAIAYKTESGDFYLEHYADKSLAEIKKIVQEDLIDASYAYEINISMIDEELTSEEIKKQKNEIRRYFEELESPY